MKVGVIVGDHKSAVLTHEIPAINDNEVLINNKACCICTTDYQQWLGLRPHQKIPMAFGHENSGVVSKIGANVKNVKIGDHVVTNSYRPCLECANCRKGMNSMYCLNQEGLNILKVPNKYGYYGFYGCSEYQIVNSKHVFQISNQISFEQACFCEPLATVIHGIKRLHIIPGENVLVIGAGTMGNLNAQIARYYGANVIISELSEKKIQTAKDLGFTKIVDVKNNDLKDSVKNYIGNARVDSIIIAVGSKSAYMHAKEIMSKGSKMLVFSGGYPAPSWTLEPNYVHYELIEIIGTYGCSTADYQVASEMLSSNKILVDKLIENRFQIDDLQAAFEASTKEDAYRVVVKI